MPAMLLPAKHKHNYTATIRVIVSDMYGIVAGFRIPVKVSYTILLLERFLDQLIICCAPALNQESMKYK